MRIRRLLTGVAVLTVALGALSAPTHAAQPAASKITITYWMHVNPPAQKLEKTLVARYEALHPNIAVNYLPVDFNSLPTKLTTALAGGGGPDLFNLFQSFVPELVQRQFLVPVAYKAFGVGDAKGFASRYLPSTVGGYTFGARCTACLTKCRTSPSGLTPPSSRRQVWIRPRTSRRPGTTSCGWGRN